MPTTAGTSPTEVKKEIDTGLSDSDINDVLDLTERDIDREYGSSPGFDDTQHRIDFEAALAALRIAEGNAPDAQDRTASTVQSGRTSQTYEASTVATLRQRVRRRDPKDAFGYDNMVHRDAARYSGSTSPNS